MIPEFEKCKDLEEIASFFETMLRTLTSEVSDTCMRKKIPLHEAMPKICDTFDGVAKTVRGHAEEVIREFKLIEGLE